MQKKDLFSINTMENQDSNMLNLQTLGSSSKGNQYIISTQKDKLLIEAGMTIKQISKALDFDFNNVIGCLVSHAHKDHSKAVKDLCDKGIQVYMTPGTMMDMRIKHHNINLIEPEKQFKLGDYTILPFKTEHDCSEPVGFLIHHKEFGKVLFATDTYYVRYKFKGLNYIMVECNYSLDILERNIREGLIPKVLRKRILTSHFSLDNVKKFLEANDLSKVQQIYLLHLSDGNSDAKLFLDEITKLTGKPTEIL